MYPYQGFKKLPAISIALAFPIERPVLEYHIPLDGNFSRL